LEEAMTEAGSGWTDERVERLKKLWGDGLSASQIAAELGGGVTRNAVIGKVHRLGLSGRGKANAGAQPRPRKPTRAPSHPLTMTGARPAAVVPRAAVAPPVDEVDAVPTIPDEILVPVSERVTIMELRESMCRWPIGDPTTPEFGFCGARAITGLPYCGHHCRIAYQPAADRKRLRA
jgi:GcrA cell cycle regulator